MLRPTHYVSSINALLKNDTGTRISLGSSCHKPQLEVSDPDSQSASPHADATLGWGTCQWILVGDSPFGEARTWFPSIFKGQRITVFRATRIYIWSLAKRRKKTKTPFCSFLLHCFLRFGATQFGPLSKLPWGRSYSTFHPD